MFPRAWFQILTSLGGVCLLQASAMQGIAWVEPSDFRILRLRTDLLSPVPEVALDRWTADIQFGLTRVEQLPAPLQLPHKVVVTATVAGTTIREIHEYSGYRLFRAQFRVVLNP